MTRGRFLLEIACLRYTITRLPPPPWIWFLSILRIMHCNNTNTYNIFILTTQAGAYAMLCVALVHFLQRIPSDYSSSLKLCPHISHPNPARLVSILIQQSAKYERIYNSAPPTFSKWNCTSTSTPVLQHLDSELVIDRWGTHFALPVARDFFTKARHRWSPLFLSIHFMVFVSDKVTFERIFRSFLARMDSVECVTSFILTQIFDERRQTILSKQGHPTTPSSYLVRNPIQILFTDSLCTSLNLASEPIRKRKTTKTCSDWRVTFSSHFTHWFRSLSYLNRKMWWIPTRLDGASGQIDWWSLPKVTMTWWYSSTNRGTPSLLRESSHAILNA